LSSTNARKNVKSLKKVDWKLALEDAERELVRTETHAEKLRNAIPILRQRVEEVQAKGVIASLA
jgi:hypothetical protein